MRKVTLTSPRTYLIRTRHRSRSASRLKALNKADNAADDAMMHILPTFQTVTRDKDSHMYGMGSVCSFPNRQSLQMVPALVRNHCFGKEQAEIDHGPDNNLNACGFYSSSVDSYAAIDIDMPKVTPVMHVVIWVLRLRRVLSLQFR